MKYLLLLVTFLLILTGCSNPPEEPLTPDMQAIVDHGTIRIGIIGADWPPYSSFERAVFENSEGKGFLLDIANALVEAVFGDAVTIEWVPTMGSQLNSIRAGDIDLDMRQLTHTLSREADVQWTVPFLLDGQQFMVKSDSGISEWADLANETICFESDYEMNLLSWSEAQGIPIEPMLVFNVAPFIDGECVALFDKWSELLHWMQLYSPTSEEGNQWVTIGDVMNYKGEPGYEPIAVAVKPDAPGLQSAINSALIDMINDGSLQEVYDEWLPEQPPWALEALLDAPLANR